MAEEKQNKQTPPVKNAGKEDAKAKPAYRPDKIEDMVTLVRILSKDIRGDKSVYRGLGQISGISWAFSNAICKLLKLDKSKKIQDLTREEIDKIEKFVANPEGVPVFLKNRRKDRDEGTDKHMFGVDLGLQVDFDIKRLKKIKAYKGIRHSLGQPVRGQRTKSHFRANKKKSGMSGSGGGSVKKAVKAAPAAAAPAKGKGK